MFDRRDVLYAAIAVFHLALMLATIGIGIYALFAGDAELADFTKRITIVLASFMVGWMFAALALVELLIAGRAHDRITGVSHG